MHPLLQLCRRIRCAVLTEGDVVAEHDFAIGVNDGIVLPIRLILVDEVKIIAEEVDDRITSSATATRNANPNRRGLRLAIEDLEPAVHSGREMAVLRGDGGGDGGGGEGNVRRAPSSRKRRDREGAP